MNGLALPDEELLSVYRTQRDYWKARAEKAERDLEEEAQEWWRLLEKAERERDALLTDAAPVCDACDLQVLAACRCVDRAALDAADRLAEMVRQHAAQNAGYDASSDITTGDIGQEYEFYRAARAAVGKAGGD